MIDTFFDFGEVIDKDSKFVIFGIPWDYLTSIKLPNSAIAPERIRSVTKDLALTTEMGIHIPKLKVVDLGDVSIQTKEVNRNIELISDFIKTIYKQKEDIIPIMIGGDHFCSYPVIKEIGEHFEKKEEFGVLIFDAHLDFYEEWDRGVYSHATIAHRTFDLDYMNKNNLMIVGTRDIDIPELKIATEENISYLNAYEVYEMGIEKYINKIEKFYASHGIKSLYISIDIDALDPSIAPGTGFAIPGGFSYREFWIILKRIAEKFDIIGFDLVEVAPNLDLSNHVTVNLASKIIIELIAFISNKNLNGI
ncbi:MAG: agmatinase [Candidatus Lokiarchaeota archaeon]|nr:agmatinase [Candidatus Lokiarchaeota archaeon]MBD3198441.1 agmatinase [Candidatus Lokiarchaeota archaeon]